MQSQTLAWTEVATGNPQTLQQWALKQPTHVGHAFRLARGKTKKTPGLYSMTLFSSFWLNFKTRINAFPAHFHPDGGIQQLPDATEKDSKVASGLPG